MKCNKCNQANPVDAKFCSACGNALAPENSDQSAPTFTTTAEATPTPITTAPISSSFNNLNASAQTKKNPAHIIMAIECVVGILIVIVVVGLVLWSALGKKSNDDDSGSASSKDSSSSILRCTQDLDAISSSVAITYQKEKMTKLEITYIFDYTVDLNKLSDEDNMKYFMASMSSMALAEYEGKDGVKYDLDEKTTIATVVFEADLTKMSKTDANELIDDFAGGSDLKGSKSAFTEEGYTCTVK